MSTHTVERCAVAVAAPPGERLACVRIVGDVDMVADPVLAEALGRLRLIAPLDVVVDLARITFACSTLANFVVRVRNLLPDGASLQLCRPSAAVRLTQEALGLDLIATLRDDLPPQWADTQPADTSMPPWHHGREVRI